MVAKIKSGKSLTGLIFYNEKKVIQGKAKLLSASGYLKDSHALTLQDKLTRLVDLSERNSRTHTNAVHISLNFAVGEQPEAGTLNEIADTYLKGIGFDGQPYLVYQHHDAGHPHIHIVTTNIDMLGKRISLHNIGKEKSEPVRKEIETAFGLIPAEQHNKNMDGERDTLLKPVIYGEMETKRSMASVVNALVSQYRFSSLRELNTLLEQYNLQADRGSSQSVMFKKGGLRYWVLDAARKRVGVPIKASGLVHKPMLKLLEKRFLLNNYLRKQSLPDIRSKVNAAMNAGDEQHFLSNLKKQSIDCVFHKNENGDCFGVTFIDHYSKTVVKGSDLGKPYSAANLQKSWTGMESGQSLTHTSNHASPKQPTRAELQSPFLEELFNSTPANESNQQGTLRKKKKKKKKRLTL